MASFTIAPLTDHTGVEVIGLDFNQPIEIETRAALNRAFAEHHVLVMRDQHFSPEQFKAAARLFGELQPHDKKERHVAGHPDVDYICNDEMVDGKRIIPGETFHVDHSNHPRPPRPRRCSRSNCHRAAATLNTSTCTTPTMICPRPPSKKSMC
jgi:alpha-ketoglutarate-dependent taurine dioxygenase